MDSYLETLVKKTSPKEEESVVETVEPQAVEEQVATVEEPVAEEVKPEPTPVAEKKEVKHSDILEPGQTITVDSIKVYNSPSNKQPFKIISGNVIYKDEVAGFKMIQYMKPGFGLVIGYTQNL